MGIRATLIAFVLIFSCTAFAMPGDWNGEASINETAVSSGTEISAYSGTNLLAKTFTPTTTAGQEVYGDDFYILVFEAVNNSFVTFKICGIAAENTTFTSGTHTVNLNVAKQDDGTYGCTCNAICAGGNCVNPGATKGVCSSNTYYCDEDDKCESAYGETNARCPLDCTASGGGGGAGGLGGLNGSEQLEENVTITEESCDENWSCTAWPETCPEDETQTRTCADENACGTTAEKPTETRACEYSASQESASQENRSNGTSGVTGDTSKTSASGISITGAVSGLFSDSGLVNLAILVGVIVIAIAIALIYIKRRK